MDRNTRVSSDKLGVATIVGFLEDGTVIVDADKTIATELAALKAEELKVMKTAAEIKQELEDQVLDIRASLQNTTENYWRKWLVEVKDLFARKFEFLKSVKNQAKATLVSVKLDASNRIAEYNSGRRY